MSRWKDFNDKDLMKLLQEAIELRDETGMNNYDL